MSRMYKVCILLCVLILVAVTTSISYAQNALPVETFSARYVLKRGGFKVGEVRRTLTAAKDGSYIYESLSKPTGLATLFVKDRIFERSTWRYVSRHPRPESYLYERTGGRKERHVKLLFDWNKGIVTNIIDNDPWKMRIPDLAQDKLLYQLTLMRDLQQGKKRLVYDVADGGKLKTYRFEILGKETVKTALGTVTALKLHRRKKDKTITIWCAIDFNYLPVKIQQNGGSEGKLRLYIDSVEGL